MKYNIEDEIKARGYKLLNLLPDFDFDFYIAGNSLNACQTRDIHDVDIFPAKDIHLSNKYDIVAETKNATTIDHQGTIIQVCKYIKPSLEELVKSFDYAHTQVGFSSSGDVYYTNDWMMANALHTSWYCGSEYPLSSVIRSLKYYKYDQLSNGKAIFSIISAITDVIHRGFAGYEDFKDQIDAVDLGLAGESDEDIEVLTDLFNLLRKDKE